MREHFVIDPLISKRQQLLLATQLCRMVLKVRCARYISVYATYRPWYKSSLFFFSMPHSALPRCATPLWLSALQAQFCTQPMRNSVHLSHSCFPSTFLTLTPALLALFVPLLHVSLRHTITSVRHGARLAAADARRFRYLPHRTRVFNLQLSDLEILMPCGLLSKDRMAS
jgi:hypothetical protein